MTGMTEVQAFARRFQLSPQAQVELCELCAGLIEGVLRESSMSLTPPAMATIDALRALSMAFGETHLDDTSTLMDDLSRRQITPLLISPIPNTADVPTSNQNDSTEIIELGGRYKDLGVLGVGGMGEVRRVLDPDLGRTLAMKILKHDHLTKTKSVARFIEEAQIGAQLQHSGLVPVHELGHLRDGRPYFTMREVRGREFGEVIQDVHTASAGGDWRPAASGWTFRKLLSTFVWVCETVGYAHNKGVVHRDLKPSNILVGANDEALVVDWGIAKVLGLSKQDLSDHTNNTEDTVSTARSQDQSQATQVGTITGTPAYMPPEQAFGQIFEIDARSDVYALGAILYSILSGHAPYQGPSALAILVAVGHGPPLSVASQSPRPLPLELVEVCERAMSRSRQDRYACAKDMAQALNEWLDGTRRRDRALLLVDEALALEQNAQHARARAEQLRQDGAALLVGVPAYAPEATKYPGWTKEDDAKKLLQQANLLNVEADQRLHAALTYVPDLPEAHTQLARRYLIEHREAETKQQISASTRAEVKLRSHADSLPTQAPERQHFAAYLRGIGALTLWTDPPGAEVYLYRYVEKHRSLEEVFERVLGVTPLHEVALEPGSYMCLIKRAGFADVRYPVFIERQRHWDGVRPGARDPFPISLPLEGSLKPSEVYVPAGWFWAGGDDEASGAIGRSRLWIDGFVVARFPVTNAEYMGFLDALVAQGREEEALQHVPRERADAAHALGAMIYGRDEQGRFVLRADSDGDIWLPDCPVVMVDLFGASAYCAHLAAKTSQPWQLPGEWHREKAARGVDGRFFPWGDGFDASRCCMRDSHEGRPQMAVVDSFPMDVSPYGVRGVAGNVRDWCADLWSNDGPGVAIVEMPCAPDHSLKEGAYRVLRGGSWFYYARFARAAFRNCDGPGLRVASVGVRPARAYP